MPEDNRSRYTEMTLCNALIDILAKKSIDRVTVSELCASAGVGRCTFYAHFEDRYALLDLVTGELAREIAAACPDPLTPRALAGALCGIMNVVATRRELCLAIRAGHCGDIGTRFIPAAGTRMWHSLLPGVAAETVDGISSFYAAGTREAVVRWLCDGCIRPPERVAAQLASFYISQYDSLTDRIRRREPIMF